MFCAKCGASLADEARFCPECGEPVPADVSAGQDADVIQDAAEDAEPVEAVDQDAEEAAAEVEDQELEQDEPDDQVEAADDEAVDDEAVEDEVAEDEAEPEESEATESEVEETADQGAEEEPEETTEQAEDDAEAEPESDEQASDDAEDEIDEPAEDETEAEADEEAVEEDESADAGESEDVAGEQDADEAAEVESDEADEQSEGEPEDDDQATALMDSAEDTAEAGVAEADAEATALLDATAGEEAVADDVEATSRSGSIAKTILVTAACTVGAIFILGYGGLVVVPTLAGAGHSSSTTAEQAADTGSTAESGSATTDASDDAADTTPLSLIITKADASDYPEVRLTIKPASAASNIDLSEINDPTFTVTETDSDGASYEGTIDKVTGSSGWSYVLTFTSGYRTDTSKARTITLSCDEGSGYSGSTSTTYVPVPGGEDDASADADAVGAAETADAAATAAAPASDSDEVKKRLEANDYVLPQSNSKNYTTADFAGLSAWELCIARNEIYARYGRQFTNADLQAYFNSKAWYTPRYTPEAFDAMDSPLNEYEKANADLLWSYERSIGSPYL